MAAVLDLPVERGLRLRGRAGGDGDGCGRPAVRNRHTIQRAVLRVGRPTVVTPRRSSSGLTRARARAKASSMSVPMSVSRTTGILAGDPASAVAPMTRAPRQRARKRIIGGTPRTWRLDAGQVALAVHHRDGQLALLRQRRVQLQLPDARSGSTEFRREVAARGLAGEREVGHHLERVEIEARVRVVHRGKEGSRMFEKNGLQYSLLDKKERMIGVPIKASSIYGSPTWSDLN